MHIQLDLKTAIPVFILFSNANVRDVMDKDKGVMNNQVIMLNNYHAGKGYPEKMRRIKFYDTASGKMLAPKSASFRLLIISS